MSMQTEVRVQKLEEQFKEMQFQMAQLVAAIDAMIEATNNAVAEGSDIEPRARNGKIRKHQ